MQATSQASPWASFSEAKNPRCSSGMFIPFCRQRSESETDSSIEVQEDLFLSFESVLLSPLDASIVVLPTSDVRRQQKSPRPRPPPLFGNQASSHMIGSQQLDRTQRYNLPELQAFNLESLDIKNSISVWDLLTPTHAASYSLLRAQEQSSSRTFQNWQDRLIYNKRQYINLDLLRVSSNTQLQNSPDFQSFVFYRRLVNGFAENWTSPQCLLHKVPGDVMSHHVSFYIAPFQLAAFRVSGEALGRFEFEELWPWMGPATADLLVQRSPFHFLNAKASASPPATSWPTARIGTFGSRFDSSHPTARPRLVVRQTGMGSPNVTPVVPEAVVGNACAQGNLLAINSLQPVVADWANVNVVMFIGGKDMLALDWMPYLSRFLHFSVASCYTDLLRKGEKSASWKDVCRDDSTGCFSSAFYLLYEYPGYGFSTAPFSPQSCVLAGSEPLIRLLDDYGLRSTQVEVHLCGYSLGSSIALRLGQELMKSSLQRPCVFPADCHLTLASMVILSPPTTISECAVHALRIPLMLRGFAGNILSKLQTESMNWDNTRDTQGFFSLLLQAKTVHDNFKLTVLHGEDDTMVASWMGQKIISIGHERIDAVIKTVSDPTRLELLRKRLKYVSIPKGTHLSVLTNPAHQKFSHVEFAENGFVRL